MCVDFWAFLFEMERGRQGTGVLGSAVAKACITTINLATCAYEKGYKRDRPVELFRQ